MPTLSLSGRAQPGAGYKQRKIRPEGRLCSLPPVRCAFRRRLTNTKRVMANPKSASATLLLRPFR